MTRAEVRAALVRALGEVAPDVDFDAISPDADLRYEAELDSMDLLNVVIALHRDLGVEVPETDYGRLRSLGSATDYLAGRLGVA